MPVSFPAFGNWRGGASAAGIPEKYPHAKFLLGHSGGNDEGRLLAYELAERSDNVFFEFCGTFVATIPWQEGIERFGNHRFVFGSDTAHHSEAYELAGLLSLPVPDEVLKPILSDKDMSAHDPALAAVLRAVYGDRHHLPGDAFYNHLARTPSGPLPKSTAEVC